MVYSEETKAPSRLKLVGGHLQSRIVSGLLELLPIIVPIAVVVYAVNLVDSVVLPILSGLVSRLSGGTIDVPSIWGGGLAVAIIVSYLVGLVSSTSGGKAIIERTISVLGKIPVVRGILSATASGDDPGDFTVPLQPGGLPGVAQRGHGCDGFRNRRGLQSQVPKSRSQSCIFRQCPTRPRETWRCCQRTTCTRRTCRWRML